jgi:hypothetical protein
LTTATICGNHDGVKTPIKISLIIIALALVACLVYVSLVVFRLRPNEPLPASVSSETSRGPSFEVHVEKPRLARPFFGILPIHEDELRFDNASPGASIGSVGQDRLELSADGGWDLSIEIDGEGRIAPATRLVFPIELGGRQVRLRCRPAGRPAGYLHIATRAGSGDRDGLDGRFLVELAACENADSGKAIEWPPAPLNVHGNFARLGPTAVP